MNILNNENVIINRKKLPHIDELMQRGICIDPDTKREFFTGYVDRILFDWDQYFEAIVQIYMGWKSDYIKNGVLIFLDHQEKNGLISRSVPVLPPDENEHVKPFLSQITNLVEHAYGEHNWFPEEYYRKLKRYIDYWIIDMDSNINGLSEWMSSVHTGMDNQHERAGYWNERFCEGVDLNSYLYLELKAFASIAESFNKKSDAEYYFSYAEKTKSLMLELMWDDTDGIFYDLDMRTNKQIKVKSISCFMPLWAKIATPEQAKRMIYEHLFNPDEFYTNYPFSAYAKTEPGYRQNLADTDIGCNWRANTWINTNYMIYHAMKYYGYSKEASIIATKTKELLNKSGNREYYNSETGEGIKQDPFWGWSLLAHFLELEETLEEDITLTQIMH